MDVGDAEGKAEVVLTAMDLFNMFVYRLSCRVVFRYANRACLYGVSYRRRFSYLRGGVAISL